MKLFVVAFITPLGFIFSSNRVLPRMIRPVLIKVLRLALKGHKTRLILQNKDDREMFLEYKIIENDNKSTNASGSGDSEEG